MTTTNLTFSTPEPVKHMAYSRAVRLLKQHDDMAAKLRGVKLELEEACADYGRAKGLWGYGPQHLRQELNAKRGG